MLNCKVHLIAARNSQSFYLPLSPLHSLTPSTTRSTTQLSVQIESSHKIHFAIACGGGIGNGNGGVSRWRIIKITHTPRFKWSAWGVVGNLRGIGRICRFFEGAPLSRNHKYLSALCCAPFIYVCWAWHAYPPQFIQYMVYICEINLLFGPKYSRRSRQRQTARSEVKNKYKDIESAKKNICISLRNEMLGRKR